MANHADFLDEVKRLFPHLTEDEQIAMAKHHAATHPGFHENHAPRPTVRVQTREDVVVKLLLLAILLMLFLMFAHEKGWAQARNGTAIVGNNGTFAVQCTSGCSAAGGSTTPTDGFANPTTAGMTASFGMLWNGASWDRQRGDTTNGAWVNCKTGCAGGSSTPSDAFANPSATAGLTMGFTMSWNGSTWDRVKGDTTNGLWVNCKSGCAGGSSTPSDAFANPTTAGLSQGFTMMWNGATWDRVKGDTTSGLWVNLKNASIAVTVASLPLPSNAAQETGGNLAAIKTDVDKIPAQGQALAAASMPVVLPAAQITTLTPPTTVTANQGSANATPWLTTDSATSATGAAPPAKASFGGYLGSGATGGFLTGAPVGDTAKAINVSTATTTLLVTGVAGRQVRITAMHLVTAAANNVAFIEGTGATCGTGTAGMAGGTTAASGYNFAANGGLTIGSGLGSVLQTVTTGDSVCVVTSAATQLSGQLIYTIY